VTRSVLAAAAVSMAAACGSSASSDGPSPSAASSSSSLPSPTVTPIHSPLLESDTDQLFAAAPGTTFLVRLTPSTGWGPLTATAGSVEEVHYRTDPGYREWQVELPTKGEVVLTSDCPGCTDQQRFRVTIDVS
jgi:hypothetical protein